MPLSIFAFLFALFLSLFLGLALVPLFRRLHLAQQIRAEGPQRHFEKAGTPTFGGLIFLIALAFTVLFLNGLEERSLSLLFLTLGFALLGFLDDLLKVVRRHPLGLRARFKFGGQLLLAFFFTLFAVLAGRGTAVALPFGLNLELGPYYFLFALLVIGGASNAVNLSDGLDGLAAGCTFLAALAYLALAQRAGDNTAAVFSAALAGGCLGFLFFNFYPARIFMGDTGALALGAALGGLAVVTRTELLLLVIGGVFVLETLSVILQVASFRLFRRRLFRMSPLHHHFELKGWAETKVVGLFWLLSFFCALAGLWGSRYFF